MLQGLNLARINELTSALTLTDLTITLPKFTFSSNIGLVSGLSQASNDEYADFSRLIESEESSLFLQSTGQSSFVTLNESGLNASSITNVKLRQKPIPIEATSNGSYAFITSVNFILETFLQDEEIEVNVNGPFVFFVRHKKSNIIPILGVMTNPSSTD
jgi:serine protease inhibitor